MSLNTKSAPIKCYAAINKNSKQLLKSASGGMFSALATKVLNDGGVVYGSAMLKNEEAILKVQHIRVDNQADLPKLLGSKYVKSSMNGVYELIDTDLQNGKTVLFSGTPCQCAALKMKYPDEKNLYLVDLICHGTPKQQLFTDYLNEIKGKSEIVDFAFRDKERGWGLCAKVTTTDKVKLIPCNVSSYYKMFLRCETYQEGCYSCKFATKERVGDLTIGDYWGIEKNEKLFAQIKEKGYDITKGISCVLATSQKGIDLLENSNIELFESTYEDIARENHQLYEPSPRPASRDHILDVYNKKGYHALEVMFNKQLGFRKYLILLKNKISPKLRMKLKMLLIK